ncbi:hypothetical protein [Rhizobium phaseoli]|uniref:hypothetical protein n=1 Tax=Rhizobium phaseoli TaxID=396 RepID=UPI0007E9F576|nr:hypothetical protein [Rhizobium phaseoli]ANL41450.1 hypothetical protein AMC88_CH03085 [Rhizobium phaseoli]ANL60438.1 hypothetical protein AMC85_CH03084 [Rhizobium phaseoli]
MITRDELYRLVWAEPASTLALKLRVSDSYLCRVCTALEVPRPPRGYWTRRKAGLEAPVPELPPLRLGSPDRWSRDRAEQVQIRPFYSRFRRRSPGLTETEHPLVAASRPHFRAAASRSAQLEEADDADDLPADAAIKDREDAADAADAAAAAESYLRLPKRLSIIDVTTSRSRLSASLELADKLYRAIEARGHRVLIAASFESFARLSVDRDAVILGRPRDPREDHARRRPTVAYVGSTPIGLAVVEAGRETRLHYAGHGRFLSEARWKKRRRAGHSWSVTRWLPTGLLKIVAYSPFPSVGWRREWNETREGALTELVDQIALDLEKVATRVGDWQKADRLSG